MSIEVANVEMARAWNGDEGDDWTRYEERYNAAARRHGLRLQDAAEIAATDHVLDIGCGCGESTRNSARAAASGSALGIDLSAQMIARARERSRSEGLANVRFEQGDAQVYPFEARAFDVGISRFGAMFFADPAAAFGNIGRALRPGGRLALTAWQELGKNEWLLTLRRALAAGRDLPAPPVGAAGPFGLADPDMVRRFLAEAGFEGIDFQDVQEPVYLGADAEGAFGFVRSLGITRGLLQDLEAPTAERALQALRAAVEAHETGEGVLLDSRAWLFTARRP